MVLVSERVSRRGNGVKGEAGSVGKRINSQCASSDEGAEGGEGPYMNGEKPKLRAGNVARQRETRL